MSLDFTVKIFVQLLKTLQSAGYTIITYAEYCSFLDNSKSISGEASVKDPMPHALCSMPFIILRHDVDALPLNSLRLAQIENSLGIRGTYYFRWGPNGFDRDVIQKIASLDHEIGYHYETVAQVIRQQYARSSEQSVTSGQKIKTLCNSVLYSVKPCVTLKTSPLEKQVIHHAYQLFVTNLRKLRRIAPVSTICMHGSPLSSFNNLDIWKTYDYRKLGISGEPWLDTDFSRVSYLTDTGRRWDGAKVSIRDKIENEGATRRRDLETERRRDEETIKRGNERSEEARERGSDFAPLRLKKESSTHYHSTRDIIYSLQKGTFPDQAMLTVHPQRWNNERLPWMKELIWQNLKNQVKWLLIKIKFEPQ